MVLSGSELDNMRSRAAASEDGESYCPLWSGPRSRAGVIARCQGGEVSLLIEVTVTRSPPAEACRTDDSARLEQLMGLQGRGYVLTFEDACSSTMERPVEEADLSPEIAWLSSALGQ